MALVLSDVITATRLRHPAFAKTRVSDAVFAAYLSDYQRVLLSKAVQRDPTFLTQSLSVALVPSTSVAGAGTGSFPVGDADSGVPSATTDPIGNALTLDTANAAQLVGPTVVTSATSTTLSSSASAWSTNAYAGDLVEITAGTGAGQLRSIVSNTGSQLTVAAWATVPDTTSIFRIVSIVAVDDDTLDLVTAFPQTTTRTGFAVRVSAQGVAYLDLTQPVTATIDAGVTLPTMRRLTGGTVHFTSGDTVAPLTIVGYADRLHANGDYCVWVENGELHLIGSTTDWQDVASLALRYVPDAPALTATTSVFLLPDTARPALVARAAVMAGQRVTALGDGGPVDLVGLAHEADEAEAGWLSEVGSQRRSRVAYVKEVW